MTLNCTRRGCENEDGSESEDCRGGITDLTIMPRMVKLQCSRRQRRAG